MSHTAPLKKIIGCVGMPMEGAAYLRPRELLECGHCQGAVQDIFGETDAVRRRCRGCASGMPVKPELSELARRWVAGPMWEMIREPYVMQTGFQLIV